MSTRTIRTIRAAAVPLIGAAAMVALQLASAPNASAAEPGVVGDRVWHEVDGDQLQDDWEPGVAGVEVMLRNEETFNIDFTATNSQGNYEFTNVDPGTYTVTFQNLPEDAFFAQRGDGSNREIDSDADEGSGTTLPFEVGEGATVKDIDAGLIMPGGPDIQSGSIGDRVWQDTNGNGIQDQGEFGISGAEITLLDSGGRTLDRTYSDADGAYRFDDLEYGTYRIRVANLSGGWLLTRQGAGSDRTKDSDVSPSSGNSGLIRIGDPQPDVTSVDVGLIQRANPRN